MTKSEAIQLIRRLAPVHDGRVSFRVFVREAGVPEQSIRHEPWFTRWNLLVAESGFAPTEFDTARIPDEQVAASVGELIKRLRKLPTQDEYYREKKHDSSFPTLKVIKRVEASGRLKSLLRTLHDRDPEYDVVRSIAERMSDVDDAMERSTNDSARVQGYVYMHRSGRKYKIGFTNSPVRRFREVRLELPDETIQVHAIATDDPSGIEKYWHGRFKEKRIRDTEFFLLDADDVRAFKRRTYQ